MENRAYALAAGLFLVLLSALAVSTAMWFRGDHVAHRALVIVTEESIAGLNVKAPVKLRGVEVGKVETINFDRSDPRRILIGLEIDANAPLTLGTYAQLGYQGVTGLAFVSLADTGTDAHPLPEADPKDGNPPRIALQPTLLDQLATAGPHLLAGANEATQRVNALLSDGNRDEFQHSLAELHQALAELNRTLKAVQPATLALVPLIRHADDTSRQAGELMASTRQRLDSLDQPLARLDHTVQDFDQLATDAGGLTRDLRTRAGALDRLGSAAAQLEASARQLDAALGTGSYASGPPLLPELTRTSQALGNTARTLSDQPQSLVFGRSPAAAGPGETGFDARLRKGNSP